MNELKPSVPPSVNYEKLLSEGLVGPVGERGAIGQSGCPKGDPNPEPSLGRAMYFSVSRLD